MNIFFVKKLTHDKSPAVYSYFSSVEKMNAYLAASGNCKVAADCKAVDHIDDFPLSKEMLVAMDAAGITCKFDPR